MQLFERTIASRCYMSSVSCFAIRLVKNDSDALKFRPKINIQEGRWQSVVTPLTYVSLCVHVL